MHTLTLTQLADGLRRKQFSSTELTQHYLARIDTLDSQYNSYITIDREGALEQAATADKHLADDAPMLCGIPIAHKDLFCTQGVLTTCASKILHNFTPTYNATIVEKLAGAGAITLGKTNMDEFAMGSSNENSAAGYVKNPWQIDCVPGGSSGGSAAAVAAGLASIATGSDTGGSIRQPASFCGLTGIKPTYGRVSRWGMIAYASSLDQAGVIAQTAEDAAIMLQAMAGFDAKDSTSVDKEVPNYQQALQDSSIQGLRIGIPKEYFQAGLDSEVALHVEAALAEYEKMGAILHPISLPHTQDAIAAYYIIAPAEASANLSRFDGVRFGHRCDNPEDLLDLYKRSRSEGFGNEVKRRILVGTYALSAGYFDAYYRKAQQVRRLVQQDFINAFKEVDVIAGPVTPTTAFALGKGEKDPVSMYLEDIYTLPTNMAGLCGLSIPCGISKAGKPIGLQLTGNYFDEARLLSIAHQFQQHTDHHQHKAYTQ